jgi:hypothetical protein
MSSSSEEQKEKLTLVSGANTTQDNSTTPDIAETKKH